MPDLPSHVSGRGCGRCTASINNRFGDLHTEDNGDVIIRFGPVSATGNWLQTLPGKSWFPILRLYGPLEPWFDQTWRPGEIKPA